MISAQACALSIERTNGPHRWHNYPYVVIQITDGISPQRGLTAAGNLLQSSKHSLEQAQVRVALGKRDPHLAHRHFNLGADLEQLEPNGIALGLGELGPLKS
jgi:hypothetical protein